jgi:hypothetical protein
MDLTVTKRMQKTVQGERNSMSKLYSSNLFPRNIPIFGIFKKSYFF